MSVRRKRWRDRKTGTSGEHWLIDVTFRHPDGRTERVRKVSPVNTRRGAEEYERQILKALLAGTFGGKEKKEAPTLAAFWARFMDDYVRVENKPSEIRKKELTYKNHLGPAFGQMRLDAIRAKHIDAYKADKRRAGLAAKSINNHLMILGKALRCAARWELIDAVPAFEPLKVQKQTFDFLSFEEAELLLERSTGEAHTMIALVLNTGLRAGEVVALKWDDVGLRTRTLTVARSDWYGVEGSPKGGDSETVPLNDRAQAALQAHRHLRGPYVFCHDDGAKLTYRQASGLLERACRLAGMRVVGLHVLRHTFASHLVMRGAPLKAVQELMRHANIQTTMRYAHLSPGVTAAAADLLTQPAPSWPNMGQVAENKK